MRWRAAPARFVVDGVGAQGDEEAGDGKQGGVGGGAHDGVQHRRHRCEQRRRVRLLRHLRPHSQVKAWVKVGGQ